MDYLRCYIQNQRRRRRAAAYSKMHYVFSGDHGDSVAQSMMYPPTTAGFSSTSSDGGDVPLNVHAENSMQADDDMVDEDEDESEADAQMHNEQTEPQEANKNTDESSRDEVAASRNRNGSSQDQGSHHSKSHDIKEEDRESRDDHVMHNSDIIRNEPNSEENGLEEGQVQGYGENQGHCLKGKSNVLKDSEGKQGKIVNQSAAEDEILDNNIDSTTGAVHTLEGGAPHDQS